LSSPPAWGGKPGINSVKGEGKKLELPPLPLREGARGWGNLHNRLRQFAGNLRNNPTDVERLLWQRLKSSQVEGIKFRRQQVLEDFIVDFVSFEKKIVIELDGGQHAETIEKDKRRDDCLIMNGYKVLRFWDNEVIQNMEGVLEVIRPSSQNR
jgi:very-short-patch-repair endonuclease